MLQQDSHLLAEYYCTENKLMLLLHDLGHMGSDAAVSQQFKLAMNLAVSIITLDTAQCLVWFVQMWKCVCTAG